MSFVILLYEILSGCFAKIQEVRCVAAISDGVLDLSDLYFSFFGEEDWEG